MIGLCYQMSRTSGTKTMTSSWWTVARVLILCKCHLICRCRLFFFSSQRKEIRTEVKDLVNVDVKKPAERQERNGMVSMFRSACLCTCKVELMYFQRNQPLPKIQFPFIQLGRISVAMEGLLAFQSFVGAGGMFFYLHMWSFVNKTI